MAYISRMQPRRGNPNIVFRRLLDEIKKLNLKEGLPIGLQRRSAKASIVGAYVPILLTLFIFWYTYKTNTKIEGWSDLITRQDSSIQQLEASNEKQDSLIRIIAALVLKQDTEISKQDTQIRNQATQIALTKGEVSSLKELTLWSIELNKISNSQNGKLTGVLKGIENAYRILNMSFLADERRSYYTLLDTVRTFSILDRAFEKLYFDERNLKGGEYLSRSSTATAMMIDYPKQIDIKLKSVQSNAFLFYDTVAQNKFLKAYGQEKSMQSFIESYLIKKLDKDQSEEVILRALVTYYTVLKSAFKEFETYIINLEPQFQNLK